MKTNFLFKVNGKPFEFEVSCYMGNFSICGTDANNVGVVVSGYIKDGHFHLMSKAPEIYFFEKQLIKAAIKYFNNGFGLKIK